jgi:hypothetical protein
MRNVFLFFICILVIFSCDHGIDPKEWADPGFGGKISFIGKWPPPDSLVDLRLVVYKKYPPPNFFEFVKFSEQLKFNVNSYEYKIYIPPGDYEYVAIAQQYGPNLFLHWRTVGFYTITSDKKYPSIISVKENTFINNMDITVDFDHLPIQPFVLFDASKKNKNLSFNNSIDIFKNKTN